MTFTFEHDLDKVKPNPRSKVVYFYSPIVGILPPRQCVVVVRIFTHGIVTGFPNFTFTFQSIYYWTIY